MKELLDKVRETGLDLIGADAEDLEMVKEAIPVVKKGLASARDLLDSIERGDKAAFDAQITKWEDVNRTLAAIHKMETAIEDSKNGVKLSQVLDVVGHVLKVVVTIGALV